MLTVSIDVKYGVWLWFIVLQFKVRIQGFEHRVSPMANRTTLLHDHNWDFHVSRIQNCKMHVPTCLHCSLDCHFVQKWQIYLFDRCGVMKLNITRCPPFSSAYTRGLGLKCDFSNMRIQTSYKFEDQLLQVVLTKPHVALDLRPTSLLITIVWPLKPAKLED